MVPWHPGVGWRSCGGKDPQAGLGESAWGHHQGEAERTEPEVGVAGGGGWGTGEVRWEAGAAGEHRWEGLPTLGGVARGRALDGRTRG